MPRISKSSPRNGVAAHLFLFPTDLGWMAAVTRGEVLCRLTFGHAAPDAAMASLDAVAETTGTLTPWQRRLRDRLTAFAKGADDDFRDIAVDLTEMSDFRRKVTERCRRIPRGKTMSYAQLAAAVGSPGAARAVGTVMRKNPLPLIIPCHRVLGAAGKIGGYSAPGGLETKRRLLELEAGPVRNKVSD